MELFDAIESNKTIEYIELLIKNGANINYQNDYGQTPLIVAVGKEKYDVRKLLIQDNANINHYYECEYTALIYSSGELNYDITKLLLDNGANVNHQNIDDRTALFYSRRNYKISKLLINYGALYDNTNTVNICKYLDKVDLFKSNITKLTGNKPSRFFFINNILLVKLISKSKCIYNKTGIPKSVLWLICSYLFY
jgi:ankyrin repeat protein